MPNTQGGETSYVIKNIYLNAVYEEEISGLVGDEANWQTTKTRHITLGNQTIAHVDVNVQGDAEKILVFSDHLGSSSLLTDSMGRVKTLYDYYPFGGTRLDSSDGLHVSAYQYTGKELDQETGLNYFGARYYEAETGRFTQSDPLLYYLSDNEVLIDNFGKNLNQILANPQALNAYAYALNNPVRYIDPDGNSSEDPFAAYKEAVGKLADWLGGKIDSYIANQQKQLQETKNHFASEFNSLSDKQKEFYGSGEKYGDTMAMLQESMYAVMGIMGGKGSNGKAFNSLDDVFSEAAKHAKERGHYIGKTVDEIAETAKNTFNNFDIKAVIKGVKKYFYNTKTNDLFVNNTKSKQPTIFQPKKGINYLIGKIRKEILNK